MLLSYNSKGPMVSPQSSIPVHGSNSFHFTLSYCCISSFKFNLLANATAGDAGQYIGNLISRRF